MKKIIYLGKMADIVILALADLDDLTPRVVPVKHIYYSDFSRMRKNNEIQVSGYVEGGPQIDTYTQVRVGIAPITYKSTSGHKVTDNIQVFISGAGHLRFFHPTFFDAVKGAAYFLMRQNIAEISPKSFTNIRYTENIEEMYGEFLGGPKLTKDSRETFIQYLLSLGLYVQHESSSNTSSYYSCQGLSVRAMSDEYTNSNPYRAPHLHKLVIPAAVRELRMNACIMSVDALYAFHVLRLQDEFYTGTPSFQIGELHTHSTSRVECASARIDRIIAEPEEFEGVVYHTSGEISDLKVYTGEHMLKEAGNINLSNCFNGSDEEKVRVKNVWIPRKAALYRCFIGADISGEVTLVGDNSCSGSFIDAVCGSVVFGKNTPDSYSGDRQINESFVDCTILGDVDVSDVRDIMNSFTGTIKGKVSLCPTMRTLTGACFVKSNLNEFELHTVENASVSYLESFRGGLQNPNATLIAYGDKGDFVGVNVAGLRWITNRDSVGERTFREAYSMCTEPVDTIHTIERGSFNEFKGKFLDFRVFPNLTKIDSRAVLDAKNLMAVIITGRTELSTVSFVRCPRLRRVFIGDDVTGITAGVFDNCATTTTIYYNENKLVERLGRLPRFKLIKGAVPEDVLVDISERQEQLESAEVVAKIAGVSAATQYKHNIESDEDMTLTRAVGVALMETGYCAELDELYKVCPQCHAGKNRVKWLYKKGMPDGGGVYHVRPEIARVFVSALTQAYPFCESVLDFDGYTIKKVKSSDMEVEKIVGKVQDPTDIRMYAGGYMLARTTFRVSGQTCYLYVVVDVNASEIIHAFTVGPNRDEIDECLQFLSVTKEDAIPCAILRYVEDADLIRKSTYRSIFSQEALKDIKNGIRDTWVPFGTFRVGKKYGVYGIDASNGGVVIYDIDGNAEDKIATYSSLDYIDVFLSRFTTRGRRHAAGIIGLKPLFAGYCDDYVTSYVQTMKDEKPVTSVDMACIPLAQDGESLRKLYGAFGGMSDSFNYSVAEVAKLFANSELFKSGKRFLKDDNVGVTDETVKLRDGSIVFKNVKYSELMYVELRQNSGKQAEYVTPCCLNKLLELTGMLVHTKRPEVITPDNIGHFTLASKPITGVTLLAVCGGGDYISNGSGRLYLGVSHVSHKACLCVSDGLNTLPLFWFNTIGDACNAAAELRYNPFARSSWTGTRYASCITRDVNPSTGIITNKSLDATRKAIISGKNSGYVSQSKYFKQLIFDLACKQPNSQLS